MPVLVVCGVSGSGKTTIARALSQELGCPFFEGDDYHPQSNVEKMSVGIPLENADRTAWLERICAELNQITGLKTLSCSALNPYVQDFLNDKLLDEIMWIKLNLTKETAILRMENRDHFMPPALLDSQFKAWSPPKGGLDINGDQPIEKIVGQILEKLPATLPDT